MSFSSYSDFSEDSGAECRQREAALLRKVNDQLNGVKHETSVTAAVVMAVTDVQKLWMVFMQDLNSEENGLEPSLKHSLLEIGSYIWAATQLILKGEFRWITNIVALNEQVADGLDPHEMGVAA